MQDWGKGIPACSTSSAAHAGRRRNRRDFMKILAGAGAAAALAACAGLALLQAVVKPLPRFQPQVAKQPRRNAPRRATDLASTVGE